jgi:DNA polymerase
MDLELLETTAASCTRCDLHKGRNKPVFAKGNPTAKLFICGMVPADNENKIGLPFVGRAGQLLDRVMEDTGFASNDVYITNLVKCYLAAGLPLNPIWIESCLPYLIVQLDLIKPKVILTLGKDASVTLLDVNPKTTMGKIRGRVYDYANIKVVPTYHPSYLLRGGGPEHRDYHKVIDDFMIAREILLDN